VHVGGRRCVQQVQAAGSSAMPENSVEPLLRKTPRIDTIARPPVCHINQFISSVHLLTVLHHLW